MMSVLLQAGADANARNMMDDAHPLENEYLVGLVALYQQPFDREYDIEDRDPFYYASTPKSLCSSRAALKASRAPMERSCPRSRPGTS